MDGGPSEWGVIVDGVMKDKLVTTVGGPRRYVLATGLGTGIHEVELYERSEAQTGITRFVGFDFGGGTLAPPPPVKAHHIEIIGDSAAAGFGVDGVGYPSNDCPGLDYAAAWQDFRKSFGAVLGRTLDAEVHGTVYSGIGMVKNIWRFLTVSPSTSDAEPPGRNLRSNILTTTTTVARERADANDERVHSFAPTVATTSELTACNGHGTPEFHERVARELADLVRQKTGW